jgi:hypothetical protein
LNVFVDFIGELLKFKLPKTIPIAVAPAAIGRQHDFFRIRIRSHPLGIPPSSYRFHRKSRSVRTQSHIDKALILENVVPPERRGFPKFGQGKIVVKHLTKVIPP